MDAQVEGTTADGAMAQPSAEIAEGDKWNVALTKAQDRFMKLASGHQLVTWAQEAAFAEQAIRSSKDLQACSALSLRDAIVNVAAIGLTLSPAEKYAYLVPRGGIATLSISYMGLVHLATSTGVCDYLRADMVREKDDFEYRGPADKPVVRISNPFSEEARGPVIGVYAIAGLSSGVTLCEIMTPEEIKAVEDVSKAKSGPWKSFRGEMIRKSAIRRLYKTIPRGASNGRMQRAIQILDEGEGLGDPSVVATTPARVIQHSAADRELHDKLVADGDALGYFAQERRLSKVAWLELGDVYTRDLPRGEKGKTGQVLKALSAEGRDLYTDAVAGIRTAFDADDEVLLSETIDGFEEYMDVLEPMVPEEHAMWMRERLAAAA